MNRLAALIIMAAGFGIFFLNPCSARTIDVGWEFDEHSLAVSAPMDFLVEDTAGGKKYIFPAKKQVSIKMCPGGFQVGPYQTGPELSFLHMSGGLFVKDIYCPGIVRLKRTDSKNITLIETLDLDYYLLGVIRAETGTGWPLEVLKVQAIISRTFALKNMNRHVKNGYNICATTHCQAYKPLEAYDQNTMDAVSFTRGLVIMYKGQLAQTYFHACCGGMVSPNNTVWESNEPVPYLKSRECPFCRNSPHYRWSRFLSAQNLSRALKSIGCPAKVQDIVSISPAHRDASLRARSFLIKYGHKKIYVKAGAFRSAVGTEIIRSTKITAIKKSKGGFTFSGYGWGHGVGLCQWGAKGMADRNYYYGDIIKRYYPGTHLETMEQ
jgi:stage II sporulation protein D